MAYHSMSHKKQGKRWPKALGAIVLVVFTIALSLCAAVVIVRPEPIVTSLNERGISVPVLFGQPSSSSASSKMDDALSRSASGSVERATGNNTVFTNYSDKAPSEQEAADLEQKERLSRLTPLIARCSGVDLRMAVSMDDLTGILFHQASYDYALPLETEVPAADYETIADTRHFNIDRNQIAKEGDWAATEALHIWRTSDTTDPDTSIDIGAQAGSTVKAPIDGTVVLVRDYRLYDEMDDVEVHIEPFGRHDLDCVIIHVSDPKVKAGDKVQAGVTDIAKVRDIESFLYDVQLSFFTPEGVGGNHAHVQMNDANTPEYREKKLEGAITPQ